MWRCITLMGSDSLSVVNKSPQCVRTQCSSGNLQHSLFNRQKINTKNCIFSAGEGINHLLVIKPLETAVKLVVSGLHRLSQPLQYLQGQKAHASE